MTASSPRTFGDLARDHLEVEVTCQKCGHRSVVDPSSDRLRDLPIAGRRYRCSQPRCGGIGLPSIGKKPWVKRLADHARSLQAVPTRKP